ncbi:hypothetical protein LPJ78_001356 [Coemansia sp. RSA 989]|nr:hypothetical protein BX667DRAFT_31561 [Coemansia mojavensis]KAJ1867039.1 hypothetical protein LPJ78_001356 [Coemansia sp. RSA 989]KAJ1871048.1 hypothetical protein LPJ55_004197 [Coemansia sp. RSA 990]KAJ2676988.1 hypothetical protein IWW42_000326 [Coemansia sp. RSA 1085]
MWQNDVSAAIVCVAINAFPKLSDVLHGAVAQGGHGSEEHVRQIFGSHGGERFGEKDNTEEIKHLCAWLSAHKIPAPRPPLMSRTIRELLDSFAQGSFSMAEMELAADTARDMETAMRERWLADAQAQKTIPAILMVQGPVPVSTFDKITSIDFDDCTHLQAKIEQRKLGELANKQREQISRLSESIDPAQVAQSLQALREWLGSRQRTLVQAAGAAVPLLGMDQLQQSLEANAQVWTQILHRLAAQRSSADRQRQMAERKRRYVLRAFLVHRRTEAGEEKYSVVRRFGDGASHFSILDAGKCRPIRLQSIEGSAVESMWVCCSDEPGSEENTVVADPDDEIFCRLCGYGESYSYNQIVLCDGCDAGVHQMCHDPVVMEEELVSSQWFCSTCRRRRQQQTAAKRVRTK